MNFGRVYEVQLGQIKVSDLVGDGRSLRCTFKVEANDKATPNKSQLSIYGLNRDHLKQLSENPSAPATIAVGYRDAGPQLIFSGNLRRAFAKKEGVDISINASAGDGDEKMATTQFKKAYARGVPYTTIVEDMVKAFGFDSYQDKSEGAISGQSEGAPAFNGDATHELTSILTPFGVRWFVQNGMLVLQKFNTTLNSTGIKIVNLTKPAELCLKKLPGQTVQTEIVSFQTLLEPSLTVGSGFELGSNLSSLNGAMIVRSIKHDGDTHGKSWFSDIEATPI